MPAFEEISPETPQENQATEPEEPGIPPVQTLFNQVDQVATSQVTIRNPITNTRSTAREERWYRQWVEGYIPQGRCPHGIGMYSASHLGDCSSCMAEVHARYLQDQIQRARAQPQSTEQQEGLPMTVLMVILAHRDDDDWCTCDECTQREIEEWQNSW